MIFAYLQLLPTKAVAMIFRSDERAARKPKLPPTDFDTGDRGYSTSRVPTCCINCIISRTSRCSRIPGHYPSRFFQGELKSYEKTMRDEGQLLEQRDVYQV